MAKSNPAYSDIPGKKVTFSVLRKTFRLYSYVKPYSFEFALGMAALFIATMANLAFPKLLGDMVELGNRGFPADEINRMVLYLFGVLVIQSAFTGLRTILLARVTEKSLAGLRRDTYSHMINLPMGFFQKHRVGELTSRIAADITLLQETLTTTLSDLFRQGLIIFGGVVWLTFISPTLTLFMLLILPVMVGAAIVFGRFIRRYSKKVQKIVAESNIVVEETFQGIQSVKAYANESFEQERYAGRTREAARAGIKGGYYRASFRSFYIIGLMGTLVAVIWKGTTLISTGQLTSGELFSFTLYTGFIAGMMVGVAGVYARVQQSVGATENVMDILDEEAEKLTVPCDLKPENQLSGKIVFENVNFHYPRRSDIEVLKNISFTIEPDMHAALVGPSGAGKSTIVNLLYRFFDPTGGRILFDGRDARDFPLTDLRSQLALVPQDVFLFGGSIRENIGYGRPGATEEEVMDAARQANAIEFIERFPEGMDTVVGERGLQLSGGQRQRVAIARAVLRNPRVLILDEATSSLDSESERQVQDALKKLMEERTSIVIAHRLATIREADTILVLDKGRLVEQGSHRELTERSNGLYRILSELQFAN